MRTTHTPPRSIRVPDEVWDAAKAEAERRGETVTDAVLRFLRRYSKTPR
ncbi:hypothetical protein EDD28_2423 [Salana multivorans]|uniref:Uncharacterized protein n=1 Tax=Salana multivorans TaxID=120377 RepID=A0A3N2DEF9_9MICO|nr:hypothetical protein [Salana multivorans]ROR97814.1 hypothetical protein EDD28_2423 [Salana multivorans]